MADDQDNRLSRANGAKKRLDTSLNQGITDTDSAPSLTKFCIFYALYTFRECRKAGIISSINLCRTHPALQRNQGFAGHCSAVRRLLRRFKGTEVEPTMILDFAPAEATQVDLGAGPQARDPDCDQMVRTAPSHGRIPEHQDDGAI